MPTPASLANSLEAIALDIKLQAAFLETASAKIQTAVEELNDFEEPAMPWINRIAEMPRSNSSFNRNFVRHFGSRGFWPTRYPDQVTGLTVHHIGSHSPLGTANYYINTKGYPVIGYHWWIGAGDGCPVYLLADPLWALWHDHTGAKPTTLSIGLAGYWHYTPPSTPQITATAKLVNYLMSLYNVDVEQVQGHRERWAYNTQCPGWGPTNRDHRSWGSNWKAEFYSALAAQPPIEW